MHRFIIILSCVIFLFASTAYAQDTDERILNYDSTIVVNKDASLDITENITAYANEHKIRHGLVRWLPTNYIDSYGVKHHTIYQLKSISVNHQKAPYHIETKNNQVTLYIGDRDITLSPGQYTYTIQYHVKNGVNFLQTQDELYWNITGNSWDFPIEKITTTLQLPPNAKITTYNAFTGKLGTQEKNYSVTRPADNQIQFTTTKPLSRSQGLTVAVGWPKGVMVKPTLIQTIHKNPDQSLSIEITAILILYYLLIWFLYGRNPRRESIIPLFQPPLNLSPAVMRYVYRMGFDVKCFTAAIVDMATKNVLTIEDKNDVVTLSKINPAESLSSEEQIVADALFPKTSSPSLQLTPDNNVPIRSAKTALSRFLSTTYKNVYFMKNTLYLIPGWIFGLLSFLIIIYSVKDDSDALFALSWFSFWAVACVMFLVGVISKIRIAYWKPSISSIFGVFFLILFASVILFVTGISQLFFLYDAIPKLTVSLFIVTLLINVLFVYLMKAPTPAGHTLMNQIAGFKLFLGTTERYRLEQFHPPEKTPELFEKMLPYAIALDVETQWGKQFTEVLRTAAQEKTSYQPSWYTGNAWSAYNPSGFSTGLMGTLTAATALASVSTNSSASGGSSGFSGGGGGGGGGGGW